MLSGPEFFDAVLESARAAAQLLGAHVYQVVSQDGEQLTLRPASHAQGLHDELRIDKAHGLGGAREICAAGTLVLVTWRGGDAGAPIVVGYLSGVLPIELELDAEEEIRIGPSAPDGGVLVGGGSRPVAMGDAQELWTQAAHALLVAIVDTLAPAPDSPLDVAAQAEALAYAAATTLGWSAAKLRTR
ncbi:MAG: hypothetical protein IT372_42635 [Polyangiaceae bacterium]|nr:hypothetical protein [Polyangiaceae bacterium]